MVAPGFPHPSDHKISSPEKKAKGELGSINKPNHQLVFFLLDFYFVVVLFGRNSPKTEDSNIGQSTDHNLVALDFSPMLVPEGMVVVVVE